MKRPAPARAVTSMDAALSRRGIVRALTTAGVAIMALIALDNLSAAPPPLPSGGPSGANLSGSTDDGVLDPEGPSMVGEASTATRVEIRSGPGEDHAVLSDVASGAQLNVSNTVQNDYRYVVHEGIAGWVPDRDIAWRSGSVSNIATTFTTTTNLNLRAEPATSAQVLLVVPPGAVVVALGEESSGFHKVSCQGTIGWAATACLV